MMAMTERSKLDEARLAVSRHAAELFWQKGFEATSGDDIAAAAGISRRTVWRYFRSKEACVEPLFLLTSYRFVDQLRRWPKSISLETYLREVIGTMYRTDEEIRDAVAAARLVSRFDREPPLRSAYLMASAQAETGMVEVVADRLDRSIRNLEVRLSAAAAMAALRIVDETVASAAINDGQLYEPDEIAEQLATSIRAVSAPGFCDPVSDGALQMRQDL